MVRQPTPSDCDALSLSAAKLVWILIGQRRQADLLQQLMNPLLSSNSGNDV